MSPASPCLRLPTPVLPQEEPRPAFFLDRDDTLIPDVPYLRDPAGVRLFPRSAAALRLLRKAGYRLLLLSNQSGVGRGLIRPEEQCLCRKPAPGLLQAALEDFPTLLEASALAGDRSADILLAHNAGIPAIQIRREGAPRLPQADFLADDLWEAAQWLLNRPRREGRP